MDFALTLEEPRLDGDVERLSKDADDLAISDPTMAELGSDIDGQLASLEKKIKEHHAPLKKKAHELHKEIVAAEKKYLEPVEAARRVVRDKLSRYAEEGRRRAEEEARRLEEIARKKEEERRLAEAAALERAGEKEAAEEVIAEPVEVAPVKAETPKVAGTSFAKTWKAEVRDLKALIKFAAANPQYSNLLKPNTTAISAMARSLKSEMKIPGVRVWSETTARRAAK